MTLSSTKNLSHLAAAYMTSAINAVTKYTDRRILTIEREDGSGMKFNVTTGDYEFPTYAETTLYVEVKEDMTAHVVYNSSRHKDTSGNWVESGYAKTPKRKTVYVCARVQHAENEVYVTETDIMKVIDTKEKAMVWLKESKQANAMAEETRKGMSDEEYKIYKHWSDRHDYWRMEMEGHGEEPVLPFSVPADFHRYWERGSAMYLCNEYEIE